ncbi:MAG: hypothetical protein H0W25_21640, partial [Acidimicrobiia bacterium]|nr:hypothetical protein [Acidimicrobiia bacterium]
VALVIAGADSAPPAPPAAPELPGGPTVEVVRLPDGSTAVRTESAPVPAADGTDIGTAVHYERTP